MSKATERMDITASTGIMALIVMVFAGVMFSSAAPASAPSQTVATVSHSVDDQAGVITVAISGGRLQK